LCTDKELTYEFLDDVIGEITALTPGPYFHIGGDESHVTPMEDYIPFIERAQDIVQKHGKISIGWDEVANAKLLEGNIAQWWASAENANKALAQGAKLLISPANKAYLDMQYDTASQYGLHWAAYIPVDSGYIWSPDQLIPEITRENILGIEAPLWSETIADLDEAEYLMFPRLLGYAEIGWTPADKRDWESYKPRLVEHGKILEDMGVDFYRSKRIDWQNQNTSR
jgi:hexosaminidase